MATPKMKSLTCTNCGRAVPAMDDSVFAMCMCGHRVDAFGVAGPEYVITINLNELTRRLWAELHRYALMLDNDQWSPQVAERWFYAWLDRVPEYGCGCQANFRAKIAMNPPDFSSRCAFFRWTVGAHNQVNQELGAPMVTYDDALALWAPNP